MYLLLKVVLCKEESARRGCLSVFSTDIFQIFSVFFRFFQRFDNLEYLGEGDPTRGAPCEGMDLKLCFILRSWVRFVTVTTLLLSLA